MTLFAIGPISFAWPWMLLSLVLVPIAGVLLLWLAAWRRGAARRLVGRGMASPASCWARGMKAGLLLGGLALLAIAAARPQIGSQAVLLPREGTDVMIALDVSASMLATDIRPNRLEHAKVLVNQLLDGLRGDRVGLTVFAGNAILRFPLTTDIDAARELVRSTAIREGGLRPGTGLGDALRVASSGFGDDSARSKLIVLISDGEDLAGDPLGAVSAPRDKNVTLYAVGLGTESGATLEQRDAQGRVTERRDPSTGQAAVSRANEALMRQLAQAGRGRFFNGNGDDAVSGLAAEIATLQRTKFQSQEGSLPVERYQWFLGAGLALLLLEMLIPERRRGRAAVRVAAGAKEGKRAA